MTTKKPQGPKGDIPVPSTIHTTTPVSMEYQVNASNSTNPPNTISLRPFQNNLTDSIAFYTAIRKASDRISFEQFSRFIEMWLGCREPSTKDKTQSRMSALQGSAKDFPFVGLKTYELIRDATELFLMTHCGTPPSNTKDLDDASTVADVANRVGREPSDLTSEATLGERWKRYLQQLDGGDPEVIPFLDLVRGSNLAGVPDKTGIGFIDSSSNCYGVLVDKLRCPCFIELIWSYWHEQGMLVQAISAISLRFQNKRVGATDPLARLNLEPLRPLSNLLWGYVQDEPRRLSVVRRVYEYDHHYGLRLTGRAVPALSPADSRTRFLESFHHLLRECAKYYRARSNTMVIADAFPALNALKELHLILAEGMHNQYGDLPWTARAEMLIQQWLLGRPEMREFLGGRAMVPNNEPWMAHVDGVKSMFNWGSVASRYFNDLAVFGERLLLSVRFGNWSQIADQNEAALWMDFHRQEIQGYLHAYRLVSGVDLTEDTNLRRPDEFAAQPSELMQRQRTSSGGVRRQFTDESASRNVNGR